MRIDIVPDLSPDFQRVGRATHFDFKTTPGFVHVRFDNGCEMKLTVPIFTGARFYTGDEPVKIAGGKVGKLHGLGAHKTEIIVE